MAAHHISLLGLDVLLGIGIELISAASAADIVCLAAIAHRDGCRTARDDALGLFRCAGNYDEFRLVSAEAWSIRWQNS